jgi:hypothetical protein
MVSVGLLPQELVLRGGGLVRPVVLTDLREVAGSLFVPLSLVNPLLHEFMTGRKASHRDLAKAQIIQALAQARNAARDGALISLQNPGVPEESFADKAGSLGFDQGTRIKRADRILRRSGATLAETAEVEVNLGGLPPWRPRVVLDAARCTVAMEASAENFERLFEFAQLAPMHDRQRPDPKLARPPRGPAEAREYFHKSKQRWVQYNKTLAEASTSGVPPGDALVMCSAPAEVAAAAGDGGKQKRHHYKFLLRRPSDEAPPRKRHSKRVRPPAAAEPEAEGLQDCLMG